MPQPRWGWLYCCPVPRVAAASRGNPGLEAETPSAFQQEGDPPSADPVATGHDEAATAAQAGGGRYKAVEPNRVPPSATRRAIVLAVVLTAMLVLATLQAAAQTPEPHIGYVYPAGGRQSAVFQVTVGGQFLEGASAAFVSGEGVKATFVEYFKPLTPGQANQLREKLQELQQKRRDRSTTRPAWTPDDEKMLKEIQQKLATFVPRPPNPAIAEMVTLKVTISGNAEPGDRAVRLLTPAGLTNPLRFCVGQLAEISKPRAGPEMTAGRPPRSRNEDRAVPPTETDITLPATVNGQIMPGGVDRFRFKAQKGQPLVMVTSARSLIPYLPDAVPGWFQPTLALYDAKGKELAYDDDYRFHPDPVLYYRIPEDGEYLMEIRDAIYRGREDFVYRVSIGEMPFVTGVFPLGGKAGAATNLDVKGWNLPLTTLTKNARNEGPGILECRVPRGRMLSNAVPFAADELPELREKEPNNEPRAAQAVTLPVIINGRIETRGDFDVFRIEGKAGDEIVAEVLARRLDSPMDSVLRLTAADGRQLAFNDDHEDKGAGLTTHHADSYLRAKLPAGGMCYLQLGDAQDKGGPEYAYRLRISPPRPDFELRIVPSSVNIRGGGSATLTAYALRKDGFAGEIKLAFKDASEGFNLSGGRVPAGQDQIRFTISAPASAAEEPVSVSIEGRAWIQDHDVVHPAVPAEDMMQAFAYRHLVPASQLMVFVSPRLARNAVRIASPLPVKIPAGGIGRVQLAAPGRGALGKVNFALNAAPPGIAIQSALPNRAGYELVLKSDAGKIKPGARGNLIITVALDRPGDKKNTRRPVGTLPAVPFEIVARKAEN